MKINKIFIIHASRGRPERGYIAYERFIESRVGNVEYTYILSLDCDDSHLVDYMNKFKDKRDVKIIVNSNRGCVEATNQGGRLLSNEDLIFVNGDDIIFPKGWDKDLFDFIANISNAVFLIHLPYNIPNSGNTAIIQCISSEFYKRRGFVFYPEFISMFGDTELLMAAKAMNAVYTGPPIAFEHEHPSFGYKVPWDDTYKRTNEAWKFTLGKKVLEKRIKENFGV